MSISRILAPNGLISYDYLSQPLTFTAVIFNQAVLTSGVIEIPWNPPKTGIYQIQLTIGLTNTGNPGNTATELSIGTDRNASILIAPVSMSAGRTTSALTISRIDAPTTIITITLPDFFTTGPEEDDGRVVIRALGPMLGYTDGYS